MKRIKLLIMLLLLLPISCMGRGGSKKSTEQNAVQQSVDYYSYIVMAEYPHHRDSYTQGLIFHEGRLYEGTGLNGESRLLSVDIESGEGEVLALLPSKHFGEGITILGDTIYQLTWVTNRLFLYSLQSGELLGEKLYSGEGWGLTTDGEKLYMSDGTSIITVRNPQTFDVERQISVTINNESINYLNELEWIDGKIWANVYTLNQIVIIEPRSGRVEGVVDLTGILPASEIDSTTDVLNGIAYDAEGGRIFVTGKNWSKLYEIKVVKR